MKIFNKHTVLFFLFILIFSCQKTTKIVKWDQVTIDSKISENKIYKDLNKEKEVFFFPEDRNSTLKKSSDVSFYAGKEINLNNDYARHNVCKAYFLLDTLIIRIGVETHFGGVGFKINFKNKKFHTKTYKTSDVINKEENKPTYTIAYQKLTLNKVNYKIGDSLFGNIEFRSVEIDQDNNQIQYFGKGYFRAKIQKF